MEDSHALIKEEDVFIACVCDGHNGPTAASFTARHFPGELKETMSRGISPAAALCVASMAVERRF